MIGYEAMRKFLRQAQREIKMKKIIGILIVLVGMAALHAEPALAVTQELSGEVVRVNMETKAVILKVDNAEGQAREVEVRLRKDTALEGVTGISSIEKGTAVRVEVKKQPFSRNWLATRLAVVQAQEKRGLNQVENAELHDLEEKAAHGEITSGEFEGRRELLKPGATIEF